MSRLPAASALIALSLAAACGEGQGEEPSAAVRIGATARSLDPASPSMAEALLSRETVARQARSRVLGEAITAERARAEAERAALAAKAEADRIDAAFAVAEAQRLADEENDRQVAASKREAAARAARTTTTVARAALVAAGTGVTPATTGAGSGRCGGDLPPCYVMERESGGNIRAQNPTSTASGKWQDLDSTWNGYGGYAHAKDAPEPVQDEFNRALYDGGAGCSHWNAC